MHRRTGWILLVRSSHRLVAVRAAGLPARLGERVGPLWGSRPGIPRCAVGALSPVGLEAPADRVNSPRQVDVQSVEVVAESVTHLDSIRGARSIGYSPPESDCRGRTTKTHFELNVGCVRNCNIALTIWEFAGPSLFIASVSRDVLTCRGCLAWLACGFPGDRGLAC